MGRYVSVSEVFKEVSGVLIFYQRSGGVTLSGGDPVAQPEFTISILKMYKNAGIHTAIDTSGYARWEILRQILEYVGYH
jgi:pyruvate formate lyase activating enzyme